MSTVAASIAKQLVEQNVPRVYQVPGESFLGLLDALRDSSIQIVTARQEGGAGFMALAEARLTNQVGVVMVTRGPGAANVAIAAHTAFQDGTPLVIFVGLIPTSDRDLEAFQEFDPKAWFGSTAKAVFVLDNPLSAAERVFRAFQIAQNGKPGPVVIGLPEEILGKNTTTTTLTKPKVARNLPEPAEFSAFMDTFSCAKKPVFVVGGDGWNSKEVQHLKIFTEATSTPVVSDFRAHDIFPHSSISWVGSLGYGRCASAAEAFDEADLVVYLGTCRKDVLSDGFVLGGREKTTVVVSPDTELISHTGKLDTHFVLTPADWIAHLPHYGFCGKQPESRLARLRKKYLEWSTPSLSDTHEITSESIFYHVRRILPENAIITAGAGNYVIGALRFISHEHPQTFVGPRNGAMGAGIPGAVAAALAKPDQTVLALAGDGCFGMNGLELSVLHAYGGKAIILLFDNSGYGTIRSHQETYFPARPSGTFLHNPDFAQLSRAHGIKAHRIEHIEAFPQLFSEAVSSTGSTLFHIVLPSIAAGSGTHDGTGTGVR